MVTPDRPSIEAAIDALERAARIFEEDGPTVANNQLLAAAREALRSRFLEQQKELTPTQGRIVDEIERRVERWYDGKRVSGEDFAADIGRLIEIIRVLSPRNPWTHPAIPESEPTWVAIQPGGTPRNE